MDSRFSVNMYLLIWVHVLIYNMQERYSGKYLIMGTADLNNDKSSIAFTGALRNPPDTLLLCKCSRMVADADISNELILDLTNAHLSTLGDLEMPADLQVRGS